MYYVESNALWFIVNTKTKRKAVSIGMKELGLKKDFIATRPATQEEIDYYLKLKGKNALLEEV